MVKAATIPSANGGPSLTVCMIVRDEAHLLPRCLASLGGTFDELCVVDTGSVDGTVALVRSLGGKVQTCTNCNGPDGRIIDFSAARNAALAMATGRWVLQLDADEIIEEGVGLIAERIRHASGCLGVTLRSDGAQWVSGRLFERNIARGYRCRIHEYLEHDGQFTLAREIVIRNLPDKAGKEPSAERNIRIIRLALTEHPEDGRLLHYLGNELRKLGRISEAIDAYSRALDLGNYRVGLYHTAYYLGCIQLVQGDPDAAIKAARRAIVIDPRYAEAHCLVADALYLQGQHLQSRAWYERALGCRHPPEDALLAVQYWTYDEHPRRQIERIDAALARATGT